MTSIETTPPALRVYVLAQLARERIPIVLTPEPIELRRGGIYTLQGPNGAGKSTIIRAIMGVHKLVRNTGQDTEVDGNSVRISSVKDALRHGLVAVFQDDEMLPTMTVIEQLEMRHGRDLSDIARHYAQKWLSRKPPEIAAPLADYAPFKSVPRDKVRANAAKLLREFGGKDNQEQFAKILDQYPSELSGGEKAIARIVSALLHENIKVLFLDEVFRGVQQPSWQHILDCTRRRAKEQNIAVMAVSHSDEEVFRWRPDARFAVQERRVNRLPPLKYHAVLPGLPQRTKVTIVFDLSVQGQENWCDQIEASAPWIVFVDASLENSPEVEKIKSQLRGTPYIIQVQCGEQSKDFRAFQQLAFAIADKVESYRNPWFLIIGGGTIINSIGFLAATLYRGVRTVLVPTTIMAIADVAIGSKTSMNIVGGPGRSYKHALGTYHNPNAVLLEKNFINRLPVNEKQNGLAECLKHGLLQDRALWEKALQLLGATAPSHIDCFAVAREAMELKAEILSIDPWEENIGRLLLYGHLHAHSLERLSHFSISHGICVLFGILVDLMMAEFRSAYSELLEACRASGVFSGLLGVIACKTDDEWRQAYSSDPKQQHVESSSFYFIKVSALAEFSNMRSLGNEQVVKTDWASIFRGVRLVLADIS